MTDEGSPLRVLHCVADWGLPSERFVPDLVTTLRVEHGVRSRVVCGRRAAGASSTAAAVPVTALTPAVSRLPYRWRKNATRALLSAVAAAYRPHVLHAHFGYWAAHTAATARRSRRPWVVSLHGYDVLVMADRDPDIAAVRRADAVIVPSRFLAGAAVDRGFPLERVHVIPSGIDLERFPFRPRRARDDGVVRVTFGGRFVAKKGVLDAAAAMAAVRGQADLRCRFVGYGPLDSQLRAALDRLGLDAEIVDGRSPDALPRALADTDLLLTPSRTADDGDAESLGLVNIEAQACGVPVVTTAHGGIPEALSPEGAVFAPEGDVEALTEALLGLVRAPDRWGRMGAAGSAHVRARYRLADRAADVAAVYRSVLARRVRPATRPESRP